MVAAHWSAWQPGYPYEHQQPPLMQLANTMIIQNSDYFSYSQWSNIDGEIRGMVSDVSAGTPALGFDGTDVIPNFLNAPPGSPPLVPIRWDLAGSYVDMSAATGEDSYGFDRGTWVENHYVALTFERPDTTTLLPDFLPPTLPSVFGVIPSEFQNSRTLLDTVQFGPDGGGFTGWGDASYPGKVQFYADDAPANSTYPGTPSDPRELPAWFTPDVVPLFLGVTDPLSPLGAHEGVHVDGRPLYVAPKILASELEPLTTIGFGIGGTSTAVSAPYTYNWASGPNTVEADTEIVSTQVPFSSVTRDRFTLVAMCGYFNGYDLPFAPVHPHPFRFLAWFNNGGATHGSWLNDRTAPAMILSPPWRYWIPADDVRGIGSGAPAPRNVVFRGR